MTGTFNGFVVPEKNYFPMPNEWIDICAGIDNLSELKVIQYVIRHTWGYHEFGITKTISVEEFMHGRKRNDGTRIDQGTGLKSDRSVKDGIKAALEHGYLVCDIDNSDKARIKKSYALKMMPVEGYNLPPDVRQVVSTPLNDENRQVVSTPPTGSIYPSEVQHLPLGGATSTPRSEKDTIERHFKKDTKDKHSLASPFVDAKASEEIPAISNKQTPSASPAAAPDLPLAPPSKPEPAALGNENDTHSQLFTSYPPEPKATTKWGTRKCLAWFDYWRGGILIGKYKLMQASTCAKGLAEQFDEATIIQVRNRMADDPYYVARGGVDVCDVANNIHKELKKSQQRPQQTPVTNAPRSAANMPANLGNEPLVVWKPPTKTKQPVTARGR